MYALRSGVLIPPSAEKSLYDPQAYVGTGSTKAKAMRRGLFNPYVMFAAPVITMDPYNNDPFERTDLMSDDIMDAKNDFNLPRRSEATYFSASNNSLFV